MAKSLFFIAAGALLLLQINASTAQPTASVAGYAAPLTVLALRLLLLSRGQGDAL